MRRKIPARKHKGVKDLERRQAQYLASIKNKINHPPTDVDEQAVPRKLLELKRVIDKLKSKEPKVKRPSKLHKDNELIDTSKFKHKEVILPGMRRAEKPVPVFKQFPGEYPHQFVNRIQRKCQEVIHECSFENKFHVSVKRNEETGKIEDVSKVPKSEIKFMTHFQTNNKPEISRSAKKREKRKKKIKEKLQAKREKNVDEFSKYKDEVKFGETVHEPPQLNILPRKSSKDEQKPGRRALLLKDMLPREEEKPSSVLADFAASKNTKKRKKSLPNAESRIMEANRLQAVQAYRMMKSRKINQNK